MADQYYVCTYAYGPRLTGTFTKPRPAIRAAISSAGSVALVNPGVMYSRAVIRDNGKTAAAKVIDVTWNEIGRTLEVNERRWRKIR